MMRWLLAGWILMMFLLCVCAPVRADWADESWGTDEASHGAVLALCTEAVTHLAKVFRLFPVAAKISETTWRDRLTGGVTCLAIGAAKEFLIDQHPSWKDLAADGAGVTIGWGVTFLW